MVVLSSPVGLVMIGVAVLSVAWTGLTVRRYAASYWFDGGIAAVSALLALAALGHSVALMSGFASIATAAEASRAALVHAVVDVAQMSLGFGVALAGLLGVWMIAWSRGARPDAVVGGAIRLRGLATAVVAAASGIAFVMALSSHVMLLRMVSDPAASGAVALSGTLYLTAGAAGVALALNVLFVPARVAALAAFSPARATGGSGSVDNPYGVGGVSS